MKHLSDDQLALYHYRDGDDIELHVGEKIGNGKGMNQVGLARVAQLSAVLERREDVGAPQQFDVGVRAVRPDLFQQIFEANHHKSVSN